MSDRIDASLLPPLLFITGAMKCAVMRGAEGNHPFVTDLPAEGPWLGKTYVVGVAR